MDDLYVEKWPEAFKTAKGTMKFQVQSLWRFDPDTKQITRIARWIWFPWGGTWEDATKSIKPARMVDGKLHKIAQKHSHILQPAKTLKLLTAEQLKELDFLVKYPERGFLNHVKWCAE